MTAILLSSVIQNVFGAVIAFEYAPFPSPEGGGGSGPGDTVNAGVGGEVAPGRHPPPAPPFWAGSEDVRRLSPVRAGSASAQVALRDGYDLHLDAAVRGAAGVGVV